MRKWIVLASYDEQGNRQSRLNEDSLDVLAIFTSGDGEEPMPGDLSEAIGARVAPEERLELLLVPLDRAKTLAINVVSKVEVQWSGNFVS